MKKVIWVLTTTLMFSLLAIGCGKQELEQTKAEIAKAKAELKQAQEELGKQTAGPGKYRVTLVKKNLTDLDWNKNTFGNPLNIKMTIYKDGNEVCTRVIDGKRGEQRGAGYDDIGAQHFVNQLEFDIEYSPTSKYIIKWEEIAVIAKAVSYSWGEDAQGGNWPFNGRLDFKQSSWLEFSAKKIQ
jgi:hypothetical protein